MVTFTKNKKCLVINGLANEKIKLTYLAYERFQDGQKTFLLLK